MISITRAERRLLRTLVAMDAISVKSLSEALGVSVPRISQIVCELRRRGILGGDDYASLQLTCGMSDLVIDYKARGWQVRDRLRRQLASNPKSEEAL